MRKFNEVLEFTSFITPDGIEYPFDRDDRFLLTEEGLGMPPIDYITQKGPYQHGETLIDYRLGTRVIQMQVGQNSCSRAAYWLKRSLMLNMLRPNRSTGAAFGPGKLRKIFEDGTVKDIDVVIQQGPAFSARTTDKWDEWGFLETLRFIAYDPTYYDPVKKTKSFSDLLDPALLDHLVFPTSFSFTFDDDVYGASGNITYLGTWLSFPKIIVNGPISGFSIENVTTGEIIKLNYSVVSGETVTIDLPYGNKTVVNDLLTNLIGSITDDSDLGSFHIAPDPEAALGVNAITISGADIDEDTSVTIEYYERYIGI